MKINYVALKEGVAPNSYWDMTLIKDLVGDLPDGDRKLFLIPGAYQGDIIPEINEYLAQFPKVMVIITSDEEGKFDCKQLKHPDMRHYCQYARCQKPFPIGYTGETRKNLEKIGVVEKDIDVFFSGQLNSNERKILFSKLAVIPRSVLFGTEGFAKGLPPEMYYDYMAHAKFAPSPPGHVAPDSFRFYEALEADAVPTDYPDYLSNLFPDMPKKHVLAWWVWEKQKIRDRFKKELGVPQDEITVVMPTSPIPLHPSTIVIDKTIESVRRETDARILVLVDGVRSQQEHMRVDYEKYVKELVFKCNFVYKNVVPVIFDEHAHQSGMMKYILPKIETPLVLFVEHDTPLAQRKFDWDFIKEKLLSGESNLIRFHYSRIIPEEHKWLMVGGVEGGLQKTKQWSQRPHIAATDFYRRCMDMFSENSNCFIEDRIHTFAAKAEWDDFKIHIYAPDENLKFSDNLNGRGEDVKYEGEQRW